MSSRKFAFSGMCLALAVVTSLIKIFSFPFGGEITLCSMLFVVLPAWLFGYGYGITIGLLYGVINFIICPYFISLPQFFFDYILAFSVMALGAHYKDSKNSLIKVYITGVILRWVVASIAGLIWVSLGSVAWDNWAPLPYTMAYNGAYIFAESAITLIILSVPSVSASLERVKIIANK